MPRKLLILAVAGAFGIHMPRALSDVLTGEKKAEQCMICHSVDNSHGAPLLDWLPARYLFKQFELYKSGKRFGPLMKSS